MSESLSESCQQFLDVARQHGLLNDESAARVAAEATLRGSAASDVAIELNLLDPAMADAVHALGQPFDLAPGYEVLGLLGRGAMGVVYRARQLNLDREVALKTVSLARIQHETAPGRFEREARVIAQLRHPNIVAAFDFGIHRGWVYIAMELVEGEDLQSRIDRLGPCSESEAWAILRQVAAALAHASDRGVVHRDIKPANILLTDSLPGMSLGPGVPFAKVSDFGLAARMEGDEDSRLTSEGALLGTPAYVAPEQLSNSGTVDHKADIYALGATLFHLLSGAAPYSGVKPLQVVLAKSMGEDSWRDKKLEGVSPETIGLFREMTHLDPNARIATYIQLLDRIDDILRAAPQANGRLASNDPAADTLDIDALPGAGKQSLPKPTVESVGGRGRHWWGFTLLALLVGWREWSDGFLLLRLNQQRASDPGGGAGARSRVAKPVRWIQHSTGTFTRNLVRSRKIRTGLRFWRVEMDGWS